MSLASPDYDTLERLNPMRAIHVVRDPRDMIVSAYFSFRNSHYAKPGSRLEALKHRLNQVPEEQGLLAVMDFHQGQLQRMRDWNYGEARVMNLKMEELSAAPYQSFLDIFRFLELLDEQVFPEPRQQITLVRSIVNKLHRRGYVPFALPIARLPAEKLLGVVFQNRYEKKAGCVKGEENPNRHYRKGKAGDWTNHFTPQHVDAFKEKVGDLLVRLGYETNDSWMVPTGEA